jgi:hypothetical protein
VPREWLKADGEGLNTIVILEEIGATDIRKVRLHAL